MRGGLNGLPWTMPNAKKKSMGKFDCPSCVTSKPGETEPMRRVMRCGFLPREQWAGKWKLPVLGPDRYNLDVCPGWVVRQPAVIEGREAYEAMEANTLHIYDPYNLVVVHKAAMVAKRAFGLHTQEQLDKPGGR